ncbi:hypothetical protein AVEN_181640-1 [Araneus ventricosus]|uniref:Uncharacterized protein n=1 Tax=Araneus ventricosus TaxID=182803 RepID=A0A4Y2CLE9_ARAVE|nr:hypothetical protein AVEN_181640-1 [Araneus ventricosus]
MEESKKRKKTFPLRSVVRYRTSLAPEGSRLETRFHQNSSMYPPLLHLKSFTVFKYSPAGVARSLVRGGACQLRCRPRLLITNHGKSLPSNAGLMVGKRVLQGEAWSDLSDSRGTHDLGDKLGDHFGDLGDK